MARLNEVPVASDSLETLRKKMLRQNRDLAKSNNIRALRIRELENECACMLSENLELRGRILELQRQVEDQETRRIADHAMAIKAKLEAQLTEWGTLIAGLGLEPPMKRHSPRIRRSSKQRMSYSACRPSPSQRRLRDVAREVEDLGHIPENKSYPRRSMNPEQILALRSEADLSMDSPELGPPPVSHFIEEDPVKLDSPSRAATERVRESSPEATPTAVRLEAHVALPSPGFVWEGSVVSSAGCEDLVSQPLAESRSMSDVAETPIAQPIKAGSKRKLAARDDGEGVQPQRMANENDIARVLADKVSVRQKLAAKALKAELGPKAGGDEKHEMRKPLADKSANNDMSSPRKLPKTKTSARDDAAAVKAKSRAAKSRPKTPSIVKMDQIAAAPQVEPSVLTPTVCDLATPVTEPLLLAPNTPEPAAPPEAARGDTPPPADISLGGEASRPSRRSRATISYAEPNLRDKMRRPTKELFDAVAGQGKYSRRTSQTESNMVDAKDEAAAVESTDAVAAVVNPEAESAPGLLLEGLPSSVVMERRKRPSNVVASAPAVVGEGEVEGEADDHKEVSISSDHGEMRDADVYEFTSSSPHKFSKEDGREAKRSNRRQTTSSRRSSAAGDDEKERSSRRRSMMI